MPVPVHTREGSAAYMNPHSMLMYHPRDKAVHLNVWTFTVAKPYQLVSGKRYDSCVTVTVNLLSPGEWECWVAGEGKAAALVEEASALVMAVAVVEESASVSSLRITSRIVCSGM